MSFQAPSTLQQAADLLFPALSPRLRATLIADPAPLGAAVALLQGIEKIFPHLTAKRDPINILFAGATEAEWPAQIALSRRKTQGLGLPSIRMTFVGLDVPADDADHLLHHIEMVGGDASTRDFHSTLLAHFHRRGHLPNPDLICLLHPGIEYNLDLWLRDTGLRDYVRQGVPVLASAYRPGEARADRAMLEAVGYELTEIVRNPAAPVVAHSTQPEGERFGHYLYSITGIDVERWHHPDVAKLAPYQSHVAYAPPDPRMLPKLHQRERITTQGTFDERQAEALTFDRLVENMGHSPYHFRRLLAVRTSPKHHNDDYAAAYLVVSTLASRTDEIDDFLANHPGAVHAVDGFGRSPLHLAAANDLPRMVEHLLRAGFDINQLSDAGETPLTCAAMEGCGECVEALVEHGAKESVGPQGMPPHLLRHFLAQVPDEADALD